MMVARKVDALLVRLSTRLFLTSVLFVFLLCLADRASATSDCAKVLGRNSKIQLFGQEILDKDGKPVQETAGVRRLLDFFKHEACVEFVFQRLPWRRAQVMALDGKGMIWEFSKNPDRLREYRFSEPVMHANIWAIAYRTPPMKLDGVDDLSGKTVSVERGVSHGMEFDAARRRLFLVDEDTASASARFRKLIAGRCDVLLWGLVQFDRALELQKYLQQTYIPSLQDPDLLGKAFYVSSKPIFIDSIHIAAKRGKFEEEMARIDLAIRRARVNGELKRLIQQL